MKTHIKHIMMAAALIFALSSSVHADIQYEQATGPGEFNPAMQNSVFVGTWKITEVLGAQALDPRVLQKAEREIGKSLTVHEDGSATMHSGLECERWEIGGLMLRDGDIPIDDSHLLPRPASWKQVGMVPFNGGPFYKVENISFACVNADVPAQQNFHMMFLANNGTLAMIDIWGTWAKLEKN